MYLCMPICMNVCTDACERVCVFVCAYCACVFLAGMQHDRTNMQHMQNTKHMYIHTTLFGVKLHESADIFGGRQSLLHL